MDLNMDIQLDLPRIDTQEIETLLATLPSE